MGELQGHGYRAELRWSGTTGVGYDAYDRTHEVQTPPAATGLTVSADPTFLGSPDLVNPEQLLLAAASSCQLLSFLAIAARSRIDVLSYVDDATAVMPADAKPMRITSMTLRPAIVVAAGTDHAKVRRVVELAHRECFIANTLATEMIIEATITDAG